MNDACGIRGSMATCVFCKESGGSLVVNDRCAFHAECVVAAEPAKSRPKSSLVSKSYVKWVVGKNAETAIRRQQLVVGRPCDLIRTEFWE